MLPIGCGLPAEASTPGAFAEARLPPGSMQGGPRKTEGSDREPELLVLQSRHSGQRLPLEKLQGGASARGDVADPVAQTGVLDGRG